MSLLDLFFGEKKKTASVAKERLQIILAHERGERSAHAPDYLPALRAELIAVVKKYVQINDIQIHHQGNLDVLEVKIDLPDTRPGSLAGSGAG